MKRRNFFSKIAKGLLGIGIVTVLPTPEVETVLSDTPQNLSATELDSDLNILRQRLNRTYTIAGTDSPKGMVEIGHELYIAESTPIGTWVACHQDGSRQYNLPEGWEKGLPLNKRIA